MSKRNERTTSSDKLNHKGTDTRVHPPEVLAFYLRIHGYDPVAFDLPTEGGVVRKGGMFAGYVRPPFFRSVMDSFGISKADVRPVTVEDKPSSELGLAKTDSGMELELFGFHPQTGEIVHMMNDGNPFYEALLAHNQRAQTQGTPRLGYSREFLVDCVELNFDHGTDIQARDGSYLRSFQTIVDIAERNSILITPIASIPHRRMRKDDVTDDSYIHRIGFDYMGWNISQHFDIDSLQLHTEVLQQEAARQAMNHKQLILPILLAPTLCGPAMDGSLRPDLSKRYSALPSPKNDRLKQQTIAWLKANQGKQFQSYRTIGRFLGSPSGGIMREPLPVNQGDYEALVEAKLKKGEIPTPARVGGHHTDRFRPDIFPFGTIETCIMDPVGGRVQRILALREFNRALDWKMQMLFISGQFEQVSKRYKALFGQKPSRKSFEQAHWNMLKVTRDGTRATVQGMDGKEYTVDDLWKMLVAFVQEPFIDRSRGIEYHGIPDRIVSEIDQAFEYPEIISDFYKDDSGYTSTRGFYETGIGNLSQWIIRAVEDRVAAGIPEEEAIRLVNIDIGQNWHNHVKSMTMAGLQEMYS